MKPPTQREILVAALGRHQVSMTNARIGTVLVSRRGYAMFRDLVANRGVLDRTDTQSDFLLELGECFAAAQRLPSRDRNGDLMVLDRDTDILFIVEDDTRILTATLDHKEARRRKRAKKRAEVQQTT